MALRPQGMKYVHVTFIPSLCIIRTDRILRNFEQRNVKGRNVLEKKRPTKKKKKMRATTNESLREKNQQN